METDTKLIAIVGREGVEGLTIRPRGEVSDDPLPAWDRCDAVLEIAEEAPLLKVLWDAHDWGKAIDLEIRAGALGRHGGTWLVVAFGMYLTGGAKATLRALKVVTTLD